MKILFLCNKSPWPPKEGGPMAMNMLIEGLLEEGHFVKVLAVNSFKYHLSEDDIPTAYKHKTGIELIQVDLRINPFDAFLNLFSGRSYHVQRFISGKFRNALIHALTTNEFDFVQLETLFMCPYTRTIREHSHAKIILRAHNIEHLIWHRIARETKNPVKKWYLHHLARTLEHYEKDVLCMLDGILAITNTDAEYFRSELAGQTLHKLPTDNCQLPAITPVQSAVPTSSFSHIPIIDLPFGINPSACSDFRGKVEFPSLFSIGSMNWIPNQEGIRWFLNNVWGDVQNQFPGLRYYIAGRGMPQWMLTIKDPNVIVLGEVENAREFIDSKAIMIVPLFSGSGIRVKIIEGMAAGKTIISTSIGAEGIRCTHLENILIADLPCDFFEMITMCITDPSLCSKIGNQAKKLVETDHNTKILIRKLVGFYQQILG
jgi:polysaccharide biosynthesis protein PslH